MFLLFGGGVEALLGECAKSALTPLHELLEAHAGPEGALEGLVAAVHPFVVLRRILQMVH